MQKNTDDMKEIEQTLDSREVAEMVEKEHRNLLKDIRRYIEQLGEVKIELTDFFKESTYKTGQNKELPCYLITKKGCELIAHKLTGVKGTIFTARYINRFHEMEDCLSGQAPAVAPVQPDQMQMLLQNQEELKKELVKMKADIYRYRLDKGGPVFGVSYNGRYPYKNIITAMMERVDDVKDEVFLRQMYTLFKRHMEKLTL